MLHSHPILLLALLALKPTIGEDISVTTGFVSTNQANGNIFYLTAKSQPVSINRFDINMRGPPAPNPAPVEVWVLPAIDPGYQDTQNFPYTKIFEGDIMGQGRDNVTQLPEFDNPVVIPAGTTYSFYVTIASLTLGTSVWYSVGTAQGNVYASDANIEIGEGYALGYPFLGYTGIRNWNGNVYYTVGAPEPQPTQSPTPGPTQTAQEPPPTQSPTPSPTQTATEPQPTQSPTPSPTQAPTGPQPTQSPTPSPTRANDTLEPTAPSSSPTSDPNSPTTSRGDGGDGSPPTSFGSTGAPTESPSLRSTRTNEPTSLGPTVWKDNLLPNEPSGTPSASFSARAGLPFGLLCTCLAVIIGVASGQC